MTYSYEDFKEMLFDEQVIVLLDELCYRLYLKMKSADAQELMGLADKVMELMKIENGGN